MNYKEKNSMPYFWFCIDYNRTETEQENKVFSFQK